MYKGITLSASLMCVDWLNMGSQIRELEENDIDRIHYDVIDGFFAPDFTMGSSIINLVQSYTKIKSDFQCLMLFKFQRIVILPYIKKLVEIYIGM